MHADFIEALGGVAPVAEYCDIPFRQVVHNWKRRGIPWRWRATVATLARKKRIPLPEKFLDGGAA
jgi:hypothetical protein